MEASFENSSVGLTKKQNEIIQSFNSRVSSKYGYPYIYDWDCSFEGNIRLLILTEIIANTLVNGTFMPEKGLAP